MSKKLRLFIIICGIVCGLGILLSVLGYAFGGQKGLAFIEDRIPFVDLGSLGPEKTETKTLAAFSSVEVDSDLGEVNFIPGDKYQVEIAYNSNDSKPKISVSGGKLKVTSNYNDRWLDLDFLGWNEERTTINVYYPKGTVFNDVKVACDLGDVDILDLNTKRLDLDADLGDIDLKRVKTTTLVGKLDLGDFEAVDVTTNGIDLEMNQGTASIDGALSGTTKVTCDLGDCDINTSLPKSQYAVTTSVDLGESEIDGDSNFGGYTVDNPNAKNKMDLNCDLGDLSVNFQ